MDNDDTRNLKRARVERLSRLRRRLGNGLVDELLHLHRDSGEANEALLDADIEELLSWVPNRSAPPASDPLPLSEEQLLATNLPLPLQRTARTVRGSSTQDDPTLQVLLARAAQLYPFLVRSCELRCRQDELLSPVVDVKSRDGEQASRALESEGLLPRRRPIDNLPGKSSFADYGSNVVPSQSADLLISSAWELCLLRGEQHTESLRLVVAENLARIRSAARGQKTTAPVVLGFSGPPVATTIDQGGFRVRRHPRGPQLAVLGRSEDLERYGVHGFTVEMNLPWNYWTGETEGPAEATTLDLDYLNRVADAIAAGYVASNLPVPLGLVDIKVAPSELPIPTLRWTRAADPIHQSMTRHYATDWPLRFAATPSPFDTRSVEVAEELLCASEGFFQVALRRTVAACQPGRPWGDALVDAVIAWEAITGKQNSDLTTRVCSVIACLACTPNEQEAAVEYLKQIYDDRSKVVHSGILPKSSATRNSAAFVALVALRQLAGPMQALRKPQNRFRALFPKSPRETTS